MKTLRILWPVLLRDLLSLAILLAALTPSHVIAKPAATLLLPTGGFGTPLATTGSAWEPFGKGYSPDPATRHGGSPSIRCQATAPAQTTGAVCGVTLDQKSAAPILVSGWSRAVDVNGEADTDYSVYVDLTYTDGTPLYGQTDNFDVGTHGWQRRSVMILPMKPVQSMRVYALFRNHQGTVWFADFQARQVPPGSLFDGQAVAPPILPVSETTGWFVRDVAAGSPLVALRPGHPALGVRLDNLRVSQGGRVIEGMVHNLTVGTRAVSVYFVRRFAPQFPVWGNDIRSAVPVTAGHEFSNLTSADLGATGKLSLYPFGCVTGKTAGLALGVPPSLAPCVTRVGYHQQSGLLYVVTDLALTGRGDPARHDQAAVGAVQYPVDPQWGFRDAAARYYALFPMAFQRRAMSHGIWMPFTDPATISHQTDFHIAYHEGDNSVATDRAQGILSFRYVEPMTYWMPMAKSVPRTYDAAMAQVRQWAVNGPPDQQHPAQAVISSGSWDAQGRDTLQFRDAPWCDGALFILDPDPRLPDPSGLWTKARLNQAGEPIPGASNQPDGEYLDSLEGWADVLNYRPAGLRASASSLIFAPNDFAPVLPTWFSVYEAAAALSSDLHRHKKLLMANTVLWRFWAFAPLLDVMGTETNMFTDSGAWRPDSDTLMNFRRTMADNKPYLLLLNTDFTKTDRAKIALYFQRCLFFDVWPSMFSANAATHPYWEDPSLYNRDRPLFAAYMPIFQDLAEAGWQPVTWAWTNVSDVWIERYGCRYLTVMNSSDRPENVTVQIAARQFAEPGRVARELRVTDLMAKAPLAVQSRSGMVTVSLRLSPSETRVLSVQPSG